MAVLCLFLLLFVFMFLGVPIAISLGLSGAVSILMFSPDSVSSLAIKLFETSDAYTFLAIPFFLLSGAFMTTGGVAQRLIDFANACVGHIRAHHPCLHRALGLSVKVHHLPASVHAGISTPGAHQRHR